MRVRVSSPALRNLTRLVSQGRIGRRYQLLFSRRRSQVGKARVCKTPITGSSPVVASSIKTPLQTGCFLLDHGFGTALRSVGCALPSSPQVSDHLCRRGGFLLRVHFLVLFSPLLIAVNHSILKIPTGRSNFSEDLGFVNHYSRGLETYHHILETSLDLFSQHGYDATSVAQICKKAQISKGAFYHHFPSKQDLFLALMTAWLDQVDGLYQSAANSAEDVPAALKGMATLSGSIFDQLEGGFPILLEFWQQAIRQPAIWKQAVAPYQRYLNFFSAIIQTGIAKGNFDENLDPQVAARLLLAIAMGLLLQASFDPDVENWQDIFYSGINIFLDGIRR